MRLLLEGVAMPNNTRETESIQVLLPWGMPLAETREGVFGAAAWWLSGGASSLLLWTVVYLMLTSL
jgi:hypothetical protein